MEGGHYRDIQVFVEKGIGKELNTGFHIIFEKHEDLEIFKKLLDKLKDGYWDAVKLSEYYFIEYSVSQKAALQKIPNAIWVWKVNKYGKVVDMDWSDVDLLMEMVEEEYKKLSKPESEKKVYHISPKKEGGE